MVKDKKWAEIIGGVGRRRRCEKEADRLPG